MRAITKEEAEAAYRVLVDVAGAEGNEDAQYAFVHAVTKETHPATEYRFMGKLGFGGKFRNNGNADNTPHVDCYPEHLTPERAQAIDLANAVLRGLFPQRD